MGAAFRIAGKDLRLRVRDRSVLILGIIAPLVLSYIFYLVFGPAATGQGLSLEYGMVDDDRSEISSSFTAVLEGAAADGVLELTTFDEAAGAAAALEEGDIDAFFHVPSGLEAAVFSNQAATIDVVGDVDSPTSTQIAASFAEQFASGVASSQTAVATAAAVAGQQVTPEFIGSLDQDPATAAMSFAFRDETAATKQLDASTFFAAGMAVFFLFFTVQFGVTGLLEEERQGTLARLMAAPIARVSVIAGKAILAFVLGVVSMAVLVVATTMLMEADWGAPLGVAVLVIAGVLSAVGIMGLVASVAKTPEGAANLGSIIAVVLGMLGGTFFPIASSGGILANLTYLTPHAWFMRGLAELGSDAPWTAALPAAAAIMVFAVVTGGLAYVLLQRRLAR
ncbi:MAG TPA: ABC transporter permease [Acidimicrobiia bacterium]|nr:ABC transporter permease [Acidimicrobiia bacterium]